MIMSDLQELHQSDDASSKVGDPNTHFFYSKNKLNKRN